MSLPRHVLSVCGLLSLALFAPTLHAQLPQAGDTTSPPTPGAGHDYLGGPSETVNPANGSVSIRIPLRISSGRQLTIPLSVAYDSAGAFYYGQSPGNNSPHYATVANVPFSKGGWSYTFPILSHTSESWTAQGPTGKNFTCTEAVNYVFQDPTGNRHNLGLAVNTTAPAVMQYCGGDASILQGGQGPILATASQVSVPPVAVTDGNGTAYSFSVNPTSITDRNGNTISISSTASSASVTDTLGRTAVSVPTFGSSPDNISVAGLASPYQVSWTTASASFTINSIQLPSGPNCPGSLSGSAGVASQVVLPNGQKYTFTYNSTYGTLSKMTYPSGGYVRYVWGLNLQAEAGTWGSPDGQGGIIQTSCRYDFPAVTDRYVSFDGTTEVLHQHFSYNTTWPSGSVTYTNKTTTVTTTDFVRNTSSSAVYSYLPLSAPCAPDISPNGLASGCIGYTTEQIPAEQCTEYYDSTGSGGTPPSSCPNLNPGGKLLKTEVKSWFNNNYRTLGSVQTVLDNGQSSLTVNCYDINEQLTETDSYDLGTSAVTPPSCANNVPSGTVAGTLLRKTTKAYATFTPHIVDLPSTVISYDGSSNRVAETDSYYNQTGGSNRGNPTTITKQCFALPGGQACPQGNSSSVFTYDSNGQMLTMNDPKNNQTSYSYADSYSSCGGNAPPTSPSDAYLTKITYPLTNGVNHIVSYCYDYTSGLMLSSTDQNNLTTNYKYADSLDRLTETDLPDGGKTTLSYNDTPPTPTVTTSKKINSSGLTVTAVAVSDGLGHTKQTQLTSDPQGAIYTDTAYDGLGRVYTVSNPYRSGSDPTTSAGTTTFAYDALGRKLTATYPDNSVVTTAYCGPSTLATDPVGKWRRSRTDGLGRLVEVDEPNAIGASVNSNGCPGQSDPIWVTSYAVNALGSLTQVVQNASHTRTFTYDSLSHLLTSNNPEVGTITYTYDADGNVATKKDARNITATYVYDALNRETSTTYSNSDPTITTTYDQSACLGLTSCQNIGHATSITDGAGSELWSYQVDATNQRSVHVNQRTTTSSPSNITKTSTYYFDLAGNLTSITYPTSRVVNYTYDSANRPATAVDSANGITYAAAQTTPPTGCLSSGVCYTPQGSEYSAAIGKTSTFNGINLSETYNNRLQPLEVKASSSAGSAFDITYSFVDPTTSKNAGHVNSITNNLDTTRSQTFTYDQLNRITGALTTSTYAASPAHCWGEAYALDAWGNLNSIAATTNSNYTGCTEESGFSTTADGNNHFPIFSYDVSGNTQNDGTIGYTYDAESQLKSVINNSVTTTYLYDGSGRRVSKSSGKLYWYGSGGEILAETTSTGATLNEYIFFNGKRIAMLPASGNPEYYAEDLLGSSRVTTQNNGTVCYDADFYPYGGERAYTNNCPSANVYKFEGKERDTETGNDDFGARYYSNRFGRWLSTDWSNVPVAVPYANLTNPQTLNLYSMVADDPESFADLDGHCGHVTMPGAPTGNEPCGNASTHALEGEGAENSGIPDWYLGEVSATSAEYAAQQQAAQNANQAQETNQNQTQQNQQTQNNQPSTTEQPATPAQSGINPNYKLPTADVVLKKASDFSAGAGDVLSFGTTYLARKYIFDSDKVVDKGSGAYITGAVTGAAISTAIGATGGAVANGKNGALFGRGGGFFNRGPVRFGWSWEGSAKAGRDVIRLGIGAARGTSWWSHIPFFYP